MRFKKINIAVWLPLIISLAVVLGFCLGYYLFSPIRYSVSDDELINRMNGMMTQNSSKIGSIVELIKESYVDNVDVDTLSEEIIPLLLKKLDPHTNYIPAKDVLKANENLEGNFDGVGIMFNMVTDTLIVLEVVPGGPSSKVGVENGDKIIKVDGINIAGVKYNQDEVVKLLRGVGGTKVKLSVERNGFDQLIEIVVTRGKVAINSLDAALMLKPTIGYVKLLRFSKTTYSEVVNAIDSLKSIGMKTLILDLKGNTGGFMDQAMLLTNEFLPKGDMIVYAESKNGLMWDQKATGSGKYIGQDLYVLVDEYSASASEIFSGAIQDNERGTIIGRRTFGKGLIQQQVSLSDGSLVNLTIARYHTPSGRSVQRPYDYGNEDKYNKEFYDRYRSSEMLNADSIKIVDSVKYYTKGGRVVYGGGGIVPDIYVALDTTTFSPDLRRALLSVDLVKFVTKYTSNHRKDMNNLTSIDKIDKYFIANESMIYSEYIKYLSAISVNFTPKQALEYKKEIMPFLKAYIGQYTPVGSSAFYSIIYPLDNITSKAVSVIESKNKIK